MGSYNIPQGRFRKYWEHTTLAEAVRDFGQSLIGAKEIDSIEDENIKGLYLPRAFFIANATLNDALEELREVRPDLCPKFIRTVKNEEIGKKECNLK